MSFEDTFTNGFEDYCNQHRVPYDFRADCETPAPWCAPWNWANPIAWFNANLSSYEMGREWARANEDELRDFFSSCAN